MPGKLHSSANFSEEDASKLLPQTPLDALYLCAFEFPCVVSQGDRRWNVTRKAPERGGGSPGDGPPYAPRGVWVLVKPPTCNHAHLGSKVGVEWALERSCFIDRIHIDTIACSHLSGQNILLNLVGIRFHYLMITLDYKHT